MTQTMRDKLQALVDHINKVKPDIAVSNMIAHSLCDLVIEELESILATEPPAVTVRAGWVCKDRQYLWWSEREPELFTDGKWDIRCASIILPKWAFTDPWAESHPNGGPECIVEVK